MKKILLLLTILIFQPICHAGETETFNLSGIIDNIISYQTKADFEADLRNNSKENFLYANKNLDSGNVIIARSEFEKTIEGLKSNLALLNMAKNMYELGFFELGDFAIEKISNKEKMQNQIAELKNAFGYSYKLTKDEESYLAKLYASIYYNSAPEEAAFNLIKKNVLLENSDYANFIMASAMFECRQYNQALIYIERAISKNAVNSKYKYFKAKILYTMKKCKEALKYIEEIENTISVFKIAELNVLRQSVLSETAGNENDKKFHRLYALYLDGNYYKTLRETQNILNFTKNNYKILTLQGMCRLALGDFKKANGDFLESAKINKNFPLTIMGLSDIKFINGNYKEAYLGYKKLFNTELYKEAVLKGSIALEKEKAPEKKLAKVSKIKNTFDSRASFEYYLISNNLFQDETNKKVYAIKSLSINLLNNDSWNILCGLDYAGKNFSGMDKILSAFLYSNSLNAEYYYYSALLLEYKNQKKEAFYEAKKSINLNPDFKPAINLMNKLQNELI